MLDYLQENPKGLDTLVESIRREKTQNFLIQKITDEVLKLRNIKLEHLKGKICWCPRNHLNMTMLLKIKYKTKKTRNDCFVFIQKVSASELHLIYIFFNLMSFHWKNGLSLNVLFLYSFNNTIYTKLQENPGIHMHLLLKSAECKIDLFRSNP